MDVLFRGCAEPTDSLDLALVMVSEKGKEKAAMVAC